MNRKFLRGLGYLAIGLIVALGAIFLIAPNGPAVPNSLGAKYYNLVYAMSSCPSATPQKYDHDGVSFDYFSLKDAPNMERPRDFYVEEPPLERGLPGYTQDYSFIAGNVFVSIFVPGKKGVASASDLLNFSRSYAERHRLKTSGLTQSCIDGAPFSVCFKDGPRQGVCFTSRSGRVYCFRDPDMAMQGGRYPFLDTLICSVIGSGCALHDYSASGMKAWFSRPSRERLAECNFLEIKRTALVRGKP